jgi:amino acid adenylation domain-containing protein
LRAVAADAQARLVLCDQRTLSLVRQAQPDGVVAASWLATDVEHAGPLSSAVVPRSTDDLAYLQYTSGSTTVPRGVMISHANVLANCAALSTAQRPDEHSATLSWLPHFHDYGLVQGILWPLFAGIAGYLMSPLTFLRRPLRWLDAIARFNITHSGAPTFAYGACVSALDEDPDWHADLRQWRVGSCGAEPIDAATVERFVQRFATHGLKPEVFAPAYGLAEATLLVSRKDDPDRRYTRLAFDAEQLAGGRVQRVDNGAARARWLVGCGVPIEGLDVRVVDPTTGIPCAADQVGELWIAGTSIGQGYHSLHDNGVFGQRLAGDDVARWLRSGDLGFVHDGELFVTGRLKDLLIVHGRNVYPQDVERAVQRACAGLRIGHGAAFAIDTPNGEQVVVVQEVERGVADERLSAMAADIRRALALELELPVHRIVLVRQGSVARTSSGKVQRNRCRDDHLQQRLPVLLDDRATPAAGSTPDAPARTDAPHGVLASLLQAAARIVGREGEALHADRSAIENGLDSLQCVRLLDWVQRETGVALPLNAALGGDTLGVLAQRIDSLLTQPRAQVHELSPSPATEDGPQPLSLQQQGVWIADRVAGNGLYTLLQATRIAGDLDLPRLRHALQQLLERHQALRLCIIEQDGTASQRVQPHTALPWEVIDLQALAADERQPTLQRQLQDLTQHRFDLARAPLLRAVLWRLSPREHTLALLVHHLVFDGWSAVVLAREWAALYGAQDPAVVALPPAAGYLRHVTWQRQWLATPAAQAMLTLQRAHLSDTPVLELPTDRPHPAQASGRGAVVRFEIDAQRIGALRALAAQDNATLFMLLMALFQTQLHRLSGQHDFAVGTPASARPACAFEHTVGLFTNTLVLRAALADDPTFRALLARVRQETLRALECELVPFDQLTESLQVQRDPRRNVLFQVGLALHSMGETALQLPGTHCEPLPVHGRTARADLWLTFAEHHGALSAELEYATDLFDASTAARLASQFQRLVDAVLVDATTPLSRLPMLGDAERHFLLEQCNATQRDYPLQWCLHELIEQQVRRTPHHAAVCFGPASLSYAELQRRANQLAHHLRTLGVGPDVVVGVCLQRSLNLPVALLAVLIAGGAYLPLDPELPAQRVAFMLRDAGVKVVLTQSSLLAGLSAAAEGVHLLAVDAPNPAWSSSPESTPPPVATPDHAAYVVYTSGSTGEPKGVTVPHRAVCNHKHWEFESIGLDAMHRVLQKTTIGFDASVFELFSPLLVGATTVLAPPGAQRDLRELVRTVRAQQISHLVMTPSAARALLAEPEFSQCASLRHLLFGGEALDHDLVRAFRACLPHLRIGNFYGPSETTEDATHHDVASDPLATGPVPIGRPIANMRCHVLDSAMQPVPIGVVGELYIGGIGVSRGYLNRPALTAERFVADPFRPGQRLYRSGDLARYRNDGELIFVGRVDSQVKVRGQRIEPGEIEATLQRCAGVQRAVVVARPDARGEAELVAYVVATGFDESALRDQLRQWLPAAHVPAAFVSLPALPTLPSGKVDLRALPAPEVLPRARHAEPPRSDTERRLLDIWRELLGRDAIGVHDNFFESGGHSLIATQLVARIRSRLAADLPLRTVFEQPTPAGQAAAVEAALAHTAAHHEAPIAPVPRDRALPLSYSQQRMWLVQQLNPRDSAYNMPFALRITGPLDTRALRAALMRLTQRHEALRTSFHLEGDIPMQRIAPRVEPSVTEVDLEHLPAPAGDMRARELAQRQAREPFDLSQAPLARVLLMRMQGQEHVLLVVVHHAVADQWSGGVLARELALAYAASRNGHEPAWAPLRIQYADYAVWQRQQANERSLDAELQHWRERLQGTQPLALPADHHAAPHGLPPGASMMRELGTDIVDGVARLAAAHGATPFMVLLAAFKLLLSRYCGQTDIALGTPIANRTRADVEDLVGTMVNTLVMRTDLAGDPSFVALLLRVKETALQAYAHQNLPYERLVEALRDAGSAASPASVRVLFNVPNAPWAAPQLQGTTVAPFEFDRGAAQFDLSVTVDTQHIHRVHVEYATATFAAQTVQRLTTHYLHLLQQALARPNAPVSTLQTLTPHELQEQSERNQGAARALPAVQRIDQLIAAQAARTPLAVALSQDERRLGYGELERRANQLAHHLKQHGVGRNMLVGLCLQRTPEMVVSLLAVLKAGGAYVPLDPAFPRERLGFMVADSGLSLVISHDAVAAPPAPAHGRTLNLDAQALAIAAEPSTAPPCDAGPTDLAYVLYTSGSTGRPKGVEIEHRGLLNFIASMQRRPGCAAGDTLLAVTTLSFDISGLELLLPLTVGARIELATREQAADSQLLIERMAAVRPTLMQATPATWSMLLAAGWTGDANLVALSGGEPLTAELAARLLARCRALWNLYGPTETTIWSTLDEVRRDSPITIGRPIDNTSVWVLDATGQPVPTGVIGELAIGGLGVARGYRNQPQLTVERFVPGRHGRDPQSRLYRTGDLVRMLADGRLVHMGRNDLQVKVRGFRIEPSEIESVLSRHPSVAHSAVAARDDSSGTRQLAAYVVTRPGAHLDPMALRAHLRASLPEYMVPTALVPLPALPLTANRKVDLQALPNPGLNAQMATRESVADPQGLLAVQLLALWRRVLDNEHLGPRDNFFDHGGHSLKAVQLLAQIERVFGRRLPLATLLQAPTVAELEQAMAHADWSTPWRSLVALAVYGEAKPPLYLVPGVGGNVLVFTQLARLFDGERAVYGLQPPGLDGMAAPLRSVPELAAHHVAEIRALQPHGPYLIGGACTGGVVAYEMAQALRRQGDEVELLILESWHPSSYRPPGRVQRFAQALRFGLKRARATLRVLASWPSPRAMAVLRRWLRRSGHRLALEETLAGHDHHTERVVSATFEAVATYDAKPYPGRLLNVIAAHRPLTAATVDTRRTWEALARGGAHAAALPAHDSGRLLVAPHVEPLAQIIRRHLEARA